MLRDIKKVFIFGGTGFLGYYAALEFLRKGVAVDTLALPVKDDKDLSGVGDWFPKEVGLKSASFRIQRTSCEVLKAMTEWFMRLVPMTVLFQRLPLTISSRKAYYKGYSRVQRSKTRRCKTRCFT